MKILHFEDELSVSLAVERSLLRSFPQTEYVLVNSPYCAGLHMALEKPDVLICDYQFEKDTLCVGILDVILEFKGLVYVFSSWSPEEIKKTVPTLPDSVKIFSKFHLREMIEDIKDNTN
mgnify:CR=1 FL=1